MTLKTLPLLLPHRLLFAAAGVPADRKKLLLLLSPAIKLFTQPLSTVRVLPDDAFGLIHGKAGVVHRADGSGTAFLGSVNESASAWKMNYELLWEDDDPSTIAWVQEEFDALWNDTRAIDLACCPFIAQDVHRIVSRRVIEPEEVTVGAYFTFDAAHCVRADGNPNKNYISHQDAFSMLTGNATIRSWGTTFLSQPFVVKLYGGYNPDYSAQTGYTTISGKLTIGKGRLIVNRLVIR